MQHACPACGAQIQFKSRFSTMSVCSFCNSMLVREQDQLKFEGQMAVLSEDMSPLQVGTQGQYNNKAFEIIGQLKIVWQEGFWNEWYVLEADGTQAWLGEALGFFSYAHEIILPAQFEIDQVRVGEEITLNDRIYVVSDIKNCTVEGVVGELPFEIQAGIPGISIDCRSSKSKCAFIECIQSNCRVFTGQYVDIEDLNLTNLRELEGW